MTSTTTSTFTSLTMSRCLTALHRVGIDEKDIQIVIALYWNRCLQVKVDDQMTDHMNIMRDVRQGCVLSATFFNIYSEDIFAEFLNISKTKFMAISRTNLMGHHSQKMKRSIELTDSCTSTHNGTRLKSSDPE